jgi:hypothetical protein
MAGEWSVTCDDGNTLGDCEVTIVLQQSWLWLDRSQGIEAQHCIVCWSCVMADMQSANCNSSIATSAEKTKMDLRSIFLDFTNVRRPKSRKDAKKTEQSPVVRSNCVRRPYQDLKKLFGCHSLNMSM